MDNPVNGKSLTNLCPFCFSEKGQSETCPVCGCRSCDSNDDWNRLKPGTTIHGRYIVGRILGQGGFGITYLGLDSLLGFKLAIKEYYPAGVAARNSTSRMVKSASSDAREDFHRGMEKFLEEARILARFEGQPNIVSVRDFFQENGTAYMVMTYLEGRTLLKYLEERGGRISFSEAMATLSPVMDALDEVHASGLIHRDISPDNIFVTHNGQVKLLDFGASKSALNLMQQKSHSVILKRGYSPPEQYQSRGSLGPWTDVYGMAATLYRCITGEPPADVMDRMAQDVLVLPIEKGADMPHHSEQAILRALSLSWESRPASLREFKSELEGLTPKVERKKTPLSSEEDKGPISTASDKLPPQRPVSHGKETAQKEERHESGTSSKSPLKKVMALLLLILVLGFSYFEWTKFRYRDLIQQVEAAYAPALENDYPEALSRLKALPVHSETKALVAERIRDVNTALEAELQTEHRKESVQSLSDRILSAARGGDTSRTEQLYHELMADSKNAPFIPSDFERLLASARAEANAERDRRGKNVQETADRILKAASEGNIAEADRLRRELRSDPAKERLLPSDFEQRFTSAKVEGQGRIAAATAQVKADANARTEAAEFEQKQIEEVEAQVSEAQRLLNELGYDVGSVDGKAGSRTITAVRTFHRSRGSTQNGEISMALLQMLREAKKEKEEKRVVLSTPAPTPTSAEVVKIYLPYHFFWNSTLAEVQVAIKAGADVNARDNIGRTSLHQSAEKNSNPEVTTALLKAGADLNARDKTGRTPLIVAAMWNSNPEVVRVLLQAGANLNATDNFGCTSLHRAAWTNPKPEVITTLLKAGADGNARDKDGQRPIDYAKNNKNLKGTAAYQALREASR